jgi:hypothetical protein
MLFVVDMGTRYLNNWPISYLVDTTHGLSVRREVQKYGRAGRLPNHLSHLINDEKFLPFITPKYYFPDPGKAVMTMEKAFDLVINMRDRIDEAGFVTWDDVLNGKNLDAPLELRSPDETFSIGGRVQIDAALGRLLEDDPDLSVYDLNVDEFIEEELASDVGSNRAKRAREHVEKVLGKNEGDSEYRIKIVDFNKIEPIKPIAKEEPKANKDYHADELIPWVLRKGDEWADKAAFYVAELQKGNEGIRFILADMKRKEDEAFYRRLESIYQLQDSKEGKLGVLNVIARSLVASIGHQISNKSIGIVYAIVAGVPKLPN